MVAGAGREANDGFRLGYVEFGGAALTVPGDEVLWYCVSGSQGWGRRRSSLVAAETLKRSLFIICVGEGLDTVACGPGQACF